MAIQTTPVFKGCTRPACLFGVPISPLITVCGSIFLAAFWTWLPLAIAIVPCIFVMRVITKHDDQAFYQWGLQLRTNRKNANRVHWNGAVSFSPAPYKRPEKKRNKP